ncbi:unnamed protein product [Calypogeia fissa]
MQMAHWGSQEILRGVAWSPDNHRIDCTSALIGRMSHKILGPKVYDPSLAKKDASMQLGQERHRREVCSSKIQEIERELQEFSEIFGSKLVELKKSMGEFAQSMKELMHYDEGNYIEDRLWEEADTNSKAVDTVTSSQSPPYR